MSSILLELQLHFWDRDSSKLPASCIEDCLITLLHHNLLAHKLVYGDLTFRLF